MLRLIVNADDLGLTSGVNRAIFEAAERGIVTSATLMGNAPAFNEAVDALQKLESYREGTLSVGCHVVLLDGESLCPPGDIPSLVDRSTKPHLRRKLWKFALAASRGQISSADVERETSAQIQKLLRAGINISHLDCHKHAHMFPPILEGVLRAASTLGIRAIRNPFEPPFARPAKVALAGNIVRSAETALLNRMYARPFRSKVDEYGMTTTDGSIGVTLTGSLDANSFARTIRSLPDSGTYEFVCHPGYSDDELAAAGTRLLQSRETELTMLCSPSSRELLQSRNIALLNFAGLIAAESKPLSPHPMG